MSKSKNHRISSTDQRWLEQLQEEAETYLGRETTLYKGELVIHSLPKPKRTRKKREEEDDTDGDYSDYI